MLITRHLRVVSIPFLVTKIVFTRVREAMMYGLTLSLKNEIVNIAPQGRVNCVAPGWVKTPMAEEAMKDKAVVYRSLAT